MKKTAVILLSLTLKLGVFAQGIPAATPATIATSAYSEELLVSRFTSWGIDPQKASASIKLKESWKKFKKNQDIVVAVVDTGIQYDHPFLKDNIHVLQGQKGEKNFGIDYSTGDRTTAPSDTHGHGTHVAGIIKSVFPEVKLLALKYYNPQASGQSNLNATIKALEYAVDQGVDVINYSGGGPEASDEELRILKKAEAKGILVIAAAGNERSNIDEKKNFYFPASYGLSNIITVGAHDEDVNIISSSNYGRKSVDIAAPGFRIKSAIHNSGVGYMTGTSQATAFVTGVVAMIKAQYPQFNYHQVRNIVLSSSAKVDKFKDKILGSGKLDAEAALTLAESVNEKLFANTRNLARTPSKIEKTAEAN